MKRFHIHIRIENLAVPHGKTIGIALTATTPSSFCC